MDREDPLMTFESLGLPRQGFCPFTVRDDPYPLPRYSRLPEERVDRQEPKSSYGVGTGDECAGKRRERNERTTRWMNMDDTLETVQDRVETRSLEETTENFRF